MPNKKSKPLLQKKKGKEKGVVNKLSFQYSSRWNKKKEDKLNEHC